MLRSELGCGAGTLEISEVCWEAYSARRWPTIGEIREEILAFPFHRRMDLATHVESRDAGEGRMRDVTIVRGPTVALQHLLGYLKMVCRLGGGVWVPPAFTPDEGYEGEYGLGQTPAEWWGQFRLSPPE